ncbi:hypothetical protein RRG08_011141 [Elysia crispata]|uniref:Uncharacterized protein n=1 Tax=Elysia crispata TaxID=231223 RepID=A0AAE1DQL2_9GAST|nr:hypothetical protein RRG08_011141 [Elysia crispata]
MVDKNVVTCVRDGSELFRDLWWLGRRESMIIAPAPTPLQQGGNSFTVPRPLVEQPGGAELILIQFFNYSSVELPLRSPRASYHGFELPSTASSLSFPASSLLQKQQATNEKTFGISFFKKPSTVLLFICLLVPPLQLASCCQPPHSIGGVSQEAQKDLEQCACRLECRTQLTQQVPYTFDCGPCLISEAGS